MYTRVLRVEHAVHRVGPFNACKFFWPLDLNWRVRPEALSYRRVLRVLECSAPAYDLAKELAMLGVPNPKLLALPPNHPGVQRQWRFGFSSKYQVQAWFAGQWVRRELARMEFVLATYAVPTQLLRSTLRQVAFPAQAATWLGEQSLVNGPFEWHNSFQFEYRQQFATAGGSNGF